MGCCMCKKALKVVAGLLLIGIGAGMLSYDAWLIVGIYLVLSGAMPMVCKCEGSCCAVEKKKR